MNIKNEVVILGKLFMYFSISLIFTCIGFLIGKAFIPENIVMMANSFIVILVVFLFLLTLSSRKQIIPQKFSMRFVYLFALIVGVLYYPILTHYFRDLGTITFVSITIGTSLLFIILTIVSYKKPEGYFLKLGNFLNEALTYLILFTISISIISNILSGLISLVGVILFSIYVIFDISLIKHEIYNNNLNEKNDFSTYVLDLYLDFINILLNLLDLVFDIKK